ncbi:hypothetical protein EZS27_025486 [termite gut metagenome]|uniref:Uncharacterized protein n=1 Tax=termite gut metagenome TaxID=433724 RepID=A0A5J4QVZ6_9ZZZZ
MIDAKHQIGVYDCDLGSLELLKPEMPKMWVNYRSYFIREIDYISKAFWESCVSLQKSFIGMKLDEIVSGTLLLPYEHAAICYYIDMPNNNYKLLEVRFDNQLHMLANSDSEYGFEAEYNKQPEGELVENAFAIVVGFHLFKRYAKIEIKEVAHNSKVTEKQKTSLLQATCNSWG